MADLIGSGYALPGTLASRYMRCGKANCRCKGEPPVLHGPYLHWTRTVAGKTVTRTLTPEQAERYQPWFDNAHRLRIVHMPVALVTAISAATPVLLIPVSVLLFRNLERANGRTVSGVLLIVTGVVLLLVG